VGDGGGYGGNAGGAGAQSSGGGQGGAASPVWLGITANGSSANGPSSPVEAQLTVLAAGARGAVLSRRWSELDEAELAKSAALYSEHGAGIMVELAIVDRAFSARPAGLELLSWDDPTVVSAAFASLDAVIAAVPTGLFAISVGRDVDVYIAGNPGQADALATLLTLAVEHASASAGADVHVGVGLTSAITSESSPSLDMLADAGDVAILSHRPGFEAGEDPSSQPPVASVLDGMMERFPDRPILLSAVAFPSDGEANATEEEQRAFYEGFFGALEPRRAAFPLVNLHMLNALDETACEQWADEQGVAAESTLAAYHCSVALWGDGAVAKKAWPEVLAGMARFASP